jgi:hypothetical protein
MGEILCFIEWENTARKIYGVTGRRIGRMQ